VPPELDAAEEAVPLPDAVRAQDGLWEAEGVAVPPADALGEPEAEPVDEPVRADADMELVRVLEGVPLGLPVLVGRAVDDGRPDADPDLLALAEPETDAAEEPLGCDAVLARLAE